MLRGKIKFYISMLEKKKGLNHLSFHFHLYKLNIEMQNIEYTEYRNRKNRI